MPRQIRREQKKVVKTPDVIVTFPEFLRRKRVWDEYYKKVPQTHAYKRFIEQKEAFRREDFGTVKRLALEARQEIMDGKYEPSKPSFPDPELEIVYGRLGIKEEDILSKAEEIFNQEVKL